MHRSYCPNLDLSQQTVPITDKQELHHLKNVLRAKQGTRISLLNGTGQEAEGEIISITSKLAEVKILSCVKIESPHPDIILACAIPKKSKFETIIEKATELLNLLAENRPEQRWDINFPGIGNGYLKREDVLKIIENLPDNVYVWERE